jgi:hypothetical protein
MLRPFPDNAVAIVLRRYERPYDDPIQVARGDALVPDPARHDATFGWIWCTGPDGRSGFVPEAWIDRQQTPWRIRRDYSALELTVEAGDRVTPHFSESGFVWVTNSHGETGWVPDAVLQLVD